MCTLRNLDHGELAITTRSHRVPLYVAVYDVIYGLIKSGDLSTGDKIPSENYLSEKLGVGRSTVRMAILVLQEDGLLVTHHGKGTYVADVRKRSHVRGGGLGYFVKDMIESAAASYGCENGTYDIIPREDFLNEKLDIREGDLLGMILKTHLADGEPVVFSQDFFKAVGPLATGDIPFATADGLFEKLVRRDATTVSVTTAPVTATEDVRRRLRVGANNPLLLVRYEVLSGDMPLVYSKHYFNTVKLEYGVTLEV